jgi:replicative DNA helicase
MSLDLRGLKDIARSLNCAVLALSQIRRLYRDPKTGKEIRPTLSDLKESGTIEEESGAVLLLSILSDEPENPVRCLYSELAKNRYGPLAIIGIEFNKLTATFKNMEGEMSQ